MARFQEIQLPLPDGYSTYGRYWAPIEAKGAVLYHHGIQSHCGWYETSAERLADAGYAVLQTDRRGSGRNQQERGHAESADQLIADAYAAGQELSGRSGINEYHVVGVSWGGKLAVVQCVTHPMRVKSLSLVTPGLFPKVGVSRGEMAKIGFAMLYERQKRFDIPLNDPEMFTTTPKWQEFFRTDPETLRKCTAAFYLASRRMDKMVTKLKESGPLPIHLFLAGDERIVDNEKTAAFVRQLHWPQCRITCFDQARHSLEFEENCETYFRDLVSFIEEHNGQ